MIELNKEYQVKINDLDYKGDGITKIGETFIYVSGLLKDEEAIIKINKIGKGFAVGSLIKIIKESKNRISQTSDLGSLSLSHLSFNEQLNWQSNITKQTLEKVLNKEINVLSPITDNNEYNYRNKVVFHVLNKSALTLGLFSNNNKKLSVINDFILSNNNVNEIIKAINNANIPIETNVLNNFVFRNNSNNEILVTITSKKKSFKGLQAIIELLQQFNNVIGLTINIKVFKEKILSDKSYLIYGENLLNEGNLLLNDQSFMQVNYGVMNLTYKTIKEHIIGNNIVDTYAGIGSIGYSVYEEDINLTIIENTLANIKLAEQIKENNNYKNVEIIHANAEDVIKDFNANTVIIDPPRKGVMKSLIDEISNNKIERVIYLSCDMQTLARDLKIFSDNYEIDYVYPVKMFPQTNSFETLVIMTFKG